MSRELPTVDIGDVPELIRLVEEVRASKKPRILRRNAEALALLSPIGARRPVGARRTRTKADYEAFRSAFGSWKGLLEGDEFLAANAESRRRSSRPPITL
jgi:hypothetical protein